MHLAARSFIAAHAANCEGPVLEVGSRDINGGVRDLFDVEEYHGIDLAAGPGVDEVVDVADVYGEERFATVVCCEVLEHHVDPQSVIADAFRLLTDGGTLLITAAGPGREPHSSHDGGQLRADEHYANITPGDLADWLRPFDSVVVATVGDDVQAVAVK